MPQFDPQQRPYTTAEAVQRYLQERLDARTARKRALVAQLRKIQESLGKWDAWDALTSQDRLNFPSRRPRLPRTTLVALRKMLQDDLDRL